MNGFVSNTPGETISDKLGFGRQERELKFGVGFSGNRGRAPRSDSFHTIRYDFKPASVDASQQASLEVGSGGSNQVTISIPHADGNGANVFKGPRKPYAKECVLIIDHETGEVTLEKLTDNITVKKTRPEGGSRITGSKPLAPVPHQPPAQPDRKNYPPLPPPMSPKDSPKTEPPPPPPPYSKSTKESKKKGKGRATESTPISSTHKGRPYSPMLNVPARHSPLALSPGHISPNPGSNHGNGHPSFSEPGASWKKRLGPEANRNPPSMPSFEDLLMNEATTVPPMAHKNSMDPTPPKPQKKVAPPPPPETFSDRSLSPIPKPMESSSGKPRPSSLIASKNQDNTATVKNELSEMSSSDEESSSSSSSSSESESSDDDLMDVDAVPIPIAPMKHLPKLPTLPSHKPKPAAPSMPFFDSTDRSGSSKAAHATLISEDLQLSEESSGSDSDSD